jgi:tetratricopeptide (TPR) repeat protein
MKKPVCFVIMGFGKKTDYSIPKTYDLDKTYKSIIQPAVIEAGYQCIRADEIVETGMIDRSMYALLVKADLVIADITTYNPNAIYELGVRHGVRPHSTIILKDIEGKIEFDFSHERIFMYKHLGGSIDFDEANDCRKRLKELILKIQKYPKNDSPLYELIRTAIPTTYDNLEYEEIIGELVNRENSLYAIVEKANQEVEKGDFFKASELFGKANQIAVDESYYIQQQTLYRYKSEKPSKIMALTDAWSIIKKLNPDESVDPETLGISGAIFKQLHLLNGEIESLDKAIEYYSKGFNVYSNYYTGENYANCLDLKAKISNDEDDTIGLKYMAKEVRKKIIKNLETISNEDLITRPDKMWIYATLSNCYLYLNKPEKAVQFEKLFLSENPKEWEKRTFNLTKNQFLNQ